MKLPSPRQLDYFLAVSETLSFSRAAELCHVSQSALSNGVTELEDIMGVKLFDRGTRRVALTSIGEDLIEPVKAALVQIENLVHLAGSHRKPLTGRLILGIIPTIAPYLLPKILPQQTIHYPDLDLQLREDITARQLDSLRKGRVDAVLMALPYDVAEFSHKMLWAEPFFLAGAKKPASAALLKIADLKKETILLLDDGHCLRDHVIESCHLTSLGDPSGLRKTLAATSLQTLIQMVQHGYGATLLPAMAIDPHNTPKGLYIQRFENPQPYRQIALVWRKNDPREAEFCLLGDFIKKSCYK